MASEPGPGSSNAGAIPVRPRERCALTAVHPFTFAVHTQCTLEAGHDDLCQFADLWEGPA